jgi:AcrR family transcriptional regulator
MGAMARPRFLRLPPAQQQAILGAARDEFAAHGFATASLNRIIESAGISKGSMYYYFDDKEDLYAEVIRRQIEQVIQQDGPVPVPTAADADGFWQALQHHYLRLMTRLAGDPVTAALLRDWLAGGGSTRREAEHEAEQEVLPWLMQTLAAGQRVGAVRTDIPAELIIAIALGMGQAMDTWLIVKRPADLAAAVATLMDMMRRALSP